MFEYSGKVHIGSIGLPQHDQHLLLTLQECRTRLGSKVMSTSSAIAHLTIIAVSNMTLCALIKESHKYKLHQCNSQGEIKIKHQVSF